MNKTVLTEDTLLINIIGFICIFKLCQTEIIKSFLWTYFQPQSSMSSACHPLSLPLLECKVELYEPALNAASSWRNDGAGLSVIKSNKKDESADDLKSVVSCCFEKSLKVQIEKPVCSFQLFGDK